MRRQAQRTPTLEERERPGLSETLTFEKHPERCQACGKWRSTPREIMRRWKEADPWDQTSAKSPIVVLCDRCSDELIEQHARLYRELEPLAPWPGAMRICIDCRHRDGTRCGSPTANINGGPGLKLRGARGQPCHVNYGGGRGEMKTLWTQDPTDCTGRELNGTR